MHVPSRAEHPIQYVVSHWIHLLAIFFLTLSGFYIHYPLFGGWMSVARGTHQFWFFVLLLNFFFRAFSAFFVKTVTVPGEAPQADIKSFLPQSANRHQVWPTLKYYTFVKREAPIQAKYNPLQKFSYGVLVSVLILLAAYTGFCLWGPTSQWAFFQWGTNWVATWFNSGGGGDPMNMRIIHYYVMWAFLIFTAVHVYLANIYSFGPSKLMFFWQEEEGA